MNTKDSKKDEPHIKNNESHVEDPCTCPEVGSLVPDYIVELLDDSTSVMVEEHLADCEYCKHRYVTVLRIRAAAALKKNRSKQLTH